MQNIRSTEPVFYVGQHCNVLLEPLNMDPLYETAFCSSQIIENEYTADTSAWD